MPELSVKQWSIFYLTAIGLLILAVIQISILDNTLSVKVLDVGQGDAILIKTPEHRYILIDSGADFQANERLGKELGYFENTIDLMILTHPHSDHFGGIPDILHRYKIKKILLTGAYSGDPVYRMETEKLKNSGTEFIFAQNDRDIQISPNIYLDVVFPFAGESLIGKIVDNANNTSIVAKLVRRTANGWDDLMLLTGDAEQEEEREILLNGQNIKADILKVGHHGSKTATSESFLNSVNPMTAVISAGKDNKFGHPHAETIDKLSGIEVRQTMKEGTVYFNF